MTTVSVVMPAYNQARYIREAIDSALQQTHPPLEVIVVDDGSTDETPRVLASYGDRIRMFRQDNRRAAAARNAGIAHAGGQMIAFLDADDRWYPRKLELQVAHFERHPDVGLVHCGMETVDGDGRTLDRHRNGVDGWVAWQFLLMDREVAFGSGSTIMLPRRVVDEVGGFDENLSPSEDWDFCYRVAERYRFGYVPEVLTQYRLHGGGAHLNIAAMERAMMLSLQKIFSSPDPAVQSLQRHTYGRLHRILAGCYFQQRQAREFMRHTVRSLRCDARNIAYFAAYPLRALARR